MNPIEKLAKIVKSQQEERQRYKEAEDIKLERRRTIDNAPTPWVVDFFCISCRKDFRRMANKVEIHYEEMGFCSKNVAFYEAKCPINKHICRRRITDKTHDEYYSLSLGIRKARIELEKDMLQPGDPRFNRVYGDPFKKYYDDMEAEERKAWKKKKATP